MRRILFYFNLIATLTCLFLALFHGEKALAAYFFLGLFQLLATLPISFKAYSDNISCGFRYYWILALAFFILAKFMKLDTLLLLTLPMLIALYNCYTYYNFYKLEPKRP